MADISVVILTYNEERHLARALDSVARFAKRVFVIDCYSTDRTVEIARSHGAVVLQHRFSSHARQLRWALDHAKIDTEWTMRLDADEVVEPNLATEINAHLPDLPATVTGVNLKRKHIFMDRWIKHGGRYPLLMLRLWRTGCGVVEDRLMDEHVTVSRGRTVTFNGGFADHNLKDLTHFIAKHNDYATKEAVEVVSARLGLSGGTTITARSSSAHAAARRWAKDQIYGRLPPSIAALGFFVYRYVFRLGFLDGREGLIYHFLQGCWYRFLVGAKALEMERAIAGLESAAEMRIELSRMTSLELVEPDEPELSEHHATN